VTAAELGKMLKDQLNTVKEIELNNKGRDAGAEQNGYRCR
jgi:hypothetical protein